MNTFAYIALPSSSFGWQKNNDRQYMYTDIIYMFKLPEHMNIQNQNEQTHSFGTHTYIYKYTVPMPDFYTDTYISTTLREKQTLSDTQSHTFECCFYHFIFTVVSMCAPFIHEKYTFYWINSFLRKLPNERKAFCLLERMKRMYRRKQKTILSWKFCLFGEKLIFLKSVVFTVWSNMNLIFFYIFFFHSFWNVSQVWNTFRAFAMDTRGHSLPCFTCNFL